MKKKIDENNLTTWPVAKLKKRALSLYAVIYQAECYATHDLRDYDAICSELTSRGYELQESRSLTIVKE